MVSGYKTRIIYFIFMSFLTPVTADQNQSSNTESYTVRIGSKTFDVPLVPLPSAGIKIAYIDLKSNIELIDALAGEISKYILEHSEVIDIIAVPEANAIALAYAVAKKTKKKYIVLSKRSRPGMGNKALKVDYKSITTNNMQELWISERDRAAIKNKNVFIFDDVISSGGTLTAARELVKNSGGILHPLPVVCFYEGKAPSSEIAQAISPTILPIIPIS